MAQPVPKLIVQLAWRTAIAVLAAVVLAWWLSRGVPDKYSARALMLLSPLPFEYTDDVPGAVSTQDIDSRRVSYVKVANIAPLAMPDYRLLFTSEDTASRVLEKVKPIYETNGLSSAGLSVAGIMGSLDLRHKTLLTSSVEVKYQQVVELVVTASHPQIAAGTANAWAEVCVEVAQQMRRAAGDGAALVLENQITDVQAQLDKIRGHIADLDQQADIDNRSQLQALDHDESLQESLLKELKTSLNAAQLVTRDAAPEFKVVSQAIPPAGPSGPDRRLYIVVAVFLALLGAPVLFFTTRAALAYARAYEEQAAKP